MHKFASNVNAVPAHLPVSHDQSAYCSHCIDDDGAVVDSPSAEQTPLLFALFGYPRARCNPRLARGECDRTTTARLKDLTTSGRR
jgi:hypothetical protein